MSNVVRLHDRTPYVRPEERPTTALAVRPTPPSPHVCDQRASADMFYMLTNKERVEIARNRAAQIEAYVFGELGFATTLLRIAQHRNEIRSHSFEALCFDIERSDPQLWQFWPSLYAAHALEFRERFVAAEYMISYDLQG